jgi:hypothetical protein
MDRRPADCATRTSPTRVTASMLVHVTHRMFLWAAHQIFVQMTTRRLPTEHPPRRSDVEPNRGRSITTDVECDRFRWNWANDEISPPIISRADVDVK